MTSCPAASASAWRLPARLIKRPRVLLLDEPLAALDKKLRAETQFELMELQRKLGTTFVIVTHDQEEAMIVADRIAVMNQGRLMQVATPTEIYEQPNSRWVADFIGEVTIIEGGGRARHDRQHLGDIGGSRTVTTGAGKTVWLALRPEKIGMSGERPAGAKNTVAGTVSEIGYRGDMSVYKIRLADGSLMKVCNRQCQCARPRAIRRRRCRLAVVAAGRRHCSDELTMQGDSDTRGWGRRAVILVPYLWLAIFFLGAVRDRAQDQPVAVGAGAAALYTGP